MALEGFGDVPAFVPNDIAFIGTVSASIDTPDTKGYAVLVTESWTPQLHAGERFAVHFVDMDLHDCTVVRPSRKMNPHALAIGTTVRVVTTSDEMFSHQIGWEFAPDPKLR